MSTENVSTSTTLDKTNNPFASNAKSEGLDSGLNDREEFELTSKNNSDSEVPKEELIGLTEAFLNFLKASIGTGVLAMACAFKYAGLWVGFASLIALSIVCLYTMHILVRCAYKLQIRLNNKNLDYAKVVEESFLLGPLYCQKISWFMGFLVNLTLGFAQLTCVAVYQVFVAENIQKVVENTTGYFLSIRYYELMLLAVLLPYILVRTLKVLAIFNGLATILTFLGMFFVLYICFIDLPPISTRPAFNSWSTYPFFIGIILFAYEGIGTVLPLRRRMKNPEEMTQICGVINIGLLFVVILTFFCGFFGYWKFGELTRESITLNMPDNQLFNGVRIMFAVGIFLTIGIQFYVVVAILWDYFSKKTTDGTFVNKYGEYILRIVLILVTFLMAVLIPHLDQLISLIGCLASALLIFVFPVLVNMLLRYSRYHGTTNAISDESDKKSEISSDNEEKSLLNGERKRRCDKETILYYSINIVDAAIAILGLTLAVIGTFATIVQIVDTFKQDLQNGI